MRTAVFDLDGTLVDTAADLIAAANAALAEAGVVASLDPLRDAAIAFRGGRAMLRLGLEDRSEERDATVERLYPRLLEHYGANICHHSRLYDGVETVLEQLARTGWRLAVCTNKPLGLAECLLGHLGIRARFAAVLGADSLPVRKPHPRHVTETVRAAGGTLSGAVLIGDTETDREAARRAGVPCILVSFGPVGRAVEALSPEALLDRYEDLPALLERLLPAGRLTG
jgi:phosphoglycolate phosphatase